MELEQNIIVDKTIMMNDEKQLPFFNSLEIAKT